MDHFINYLFDGRYRIISCVGQGAMGRVYRARDGLLEYDVAVKTLELRGMGRQGREDELNSRFRREAKAAAWSSSHPNIVTIHHIGEAHDDQPAYIVMGYVEGEPLHKLLEKEKNLPPPRAISLMLEICAGVGAAHRNEVVHRDLKPANVMVIPPDAIRRHETVKVLDFGLAKLHRLNDGLPFTQITRLGQLIGSPAYMPPEQWDVEMLDEKDYSGDVYSLGIMLYEMLKGEVPFIGRSLQELRDMHLSQPPPSLNIRQVPTGVEYVIRRALEKERRNRPPNATEFAHELRTEWESALKARRRRKVEERHIHREEEKARHQAEVEQLKLRVAAAEQRAVEEQQRHEETAKALQQNIHVIARMNFELRSAQANSEAAIRQRVDVEAALQSILEGVDSLAEAVSQVRERAGTEISRLREQDQVVGDNITEELLVPEGTGIQHEAGESSADTDKEIEKPAVDETEYLRIRLNSALEEIKRWVSKADAAQAEVDKLKSKHEATLSRLTSEYEKAKADLLAGDKPTSSTSAFPTGLTRESRAVRPLRIGSILRNWFYGISTTDLAIDLGTANTLVYAKGRGIVISEPSIVAIDKVSNQVEAVGKEAKELLVRKPSTTIIVRPMKDGVIANFEVTEKMLQHFIRKAHNGKSWVSPRAIISIPSDITEIERRGIEDVVFRVKASEVYLVEDAMAAAIGAGLPITEPHGNMIVDIGGGTTNIAVISLSGIVYSRAVRVAGNEMDEAITQYIKRKYNLLIGERTAEAIKIELGSASPLDESLLMDVRGRNLIEGIPKTIEITDDEVREALADSVATIVNAVRIALERIPPELSADIVERGIVLTGGGALLKNLDKRLSLETGIPVSVTKDPLSDVILGLGTLLGDFNLLRQVRWNNYLTT